MVGLPSYLSVVVPSLRMNRMSCNLRDPGFSRERDVSGLRAVHKLIVAIRDGS